MERRRGTICGTAHSDRERVYSGEEGKGRVRCVFEYREDSSEPSVGDLRGWLVMRVEMGSLRGWLSCTVAVVVALTEGIYELVCFGSS